RGEGKADPGQHIPTRCRTCLVAVNLRAGRGRLGKRLHDTRRERRYFPVGTVIVREPGKSRPERRGCRFPRHAAQAGGLAPGVQLKSCKSGKHTERVPAFLLPNIRPEERAVLRMV